MKRISIAFAGLALIVSVVPALAHHAFSSEFDVNRPIAFTGKVTRVELINPHSWIHVDVEDDDGNVTSWRIEGGSPNALLRRGIDRNSIPVGSEIRVDGYGSRDGGNKGVGVELEFADGRPLFFGGTRRTGN